MFNASITVNGADVVERALAQLPEAIKDGADDAAPAVNDLVTADFGGGKPLYPGLSEHNQPPFPFYIRGVGEQWDDAHNDNKSEQMDTRFYFNAYGGSTHIGNTASYGPNVIGSAQDPLFAAIGWRKLFDVAKEKIEAIKALWRDSIARRIAALFRGGVGP